MKDLALVLMTCDKYMYLVEMWYYFYLKYVNLDIPIYVVNETKDLTIQGKWIRQIKINEPDINKWTYRVRQAIHKVPEDNIFLCLEDVFFNKPLTTLIQDLYFFFKLVDADSVRLSTVPSKRVTYAETQYINFNRISQRSWYTISYEPNIWKKAHLMRCIPVNESPWDSELEGSKRLHNTDHKTYFYLLEGSHVNVIQKGKVTKQGQILINEYNENCKPDII